MKRMLRFSLAGVCLVAPLIVLVSSGKAANAQSTNPSVQIFFASPLPSSRPNPESPLPPNLKTIYFEGLNYIYRTGYDANESLSVNAVSSIKVNGSDIIYDSSTPLSYSGLKHANINGEYEDSYTLKGIKQLMAKQELEANGESEWYVSRVKNGPNAPAVYYIGTGQVDFYTGKPTEQPPIE